jgi:hypothetical protein
MQMPNENEQIAHGFNDPNQLPKNPSKDIKFEPSKKKKKKTLILFTDLIFFLSFF